MEIFSSDNIINVNPTNWITIVVMALTMFFLLGLLQKYLQGKVSNADSQS